MFHSFQNTRNFSDLAGDNFKLKDEMNALKISVANATGVKEFVVNQILCKIHIYG